MANERLPKQNPEILDSDFTFVQKDDSIHDKKFQTRPTTFFRDAMKRFVKNKSSVVAAGILAILILMAIIVPLADRNDISSTIQEMQYLPPKWFSGDMNGFLDGTQKVDHVVLDPTNRDSNGNYMLPEDSSYAQNAIIGEISAEESYANMLTGAVQKYGKGGYIALSNSGERDLTTREWYSDGPAGLRSDYVTFSSSETVSFEVNFSYEKTKATILDGSELKAHLFFVISGESGLSSIDLTDEYSFDGEEAFTSIECEDVVAKILEAKPSVAGEIQGSFGIELSEPDDVKYTTEVLYIKEMIARASSSDVSAATFTDATKALTAITNAAEGAYMRYGTANLSIDSSVVLYGSFRYDFYKAIFGSTDDDDPKPVFRTEIFTKNDVDQFIARGWMTYEWGNGTKLGTFELTELGKTYCPIRGVIAQDIRRDPFHPNDPSRTTYELTAKTSYYRLLAYRGILGDYNPPHFIFGTDKNGKDFFKVVFSGLLTSLGLGFMSAAINIAIGLVWGAIAGYFGGWVDLLMERFVEILSGMPWIVMMTLIVLLTGSNSFGIFLLALCITGWIGISGVTRSQFYRYKRREYVLASRTLGASDFRLIFRHILPNAIGTIVTSAVLMIPGVIFTEANIAYLLPGTMQLKGSFGVSLSDVQGDLNLYPFLIVSASIIMALIMISFNLFGNGLRDAFNPSLKGSDE